MAEGKGWPGWVDLDSWLCLDGLQQKAKLAIVKRQSEGNSSLTDSKCNPGIEKSQDPVLGLALQIGRYFGITYRLISRIRCSSPVWKVCQNGTGSDCYFQNTYYSAQQGVEL